MKNVRIWSLFFYGILKSCLPAKDKLSEEVILKKDSYYESPFPVPFVDSFRVWYKDSMAIEEITQMQFITDANDITTVGRKITRYLFIDRRTKMFYEYHTFSDTAKMMKAYSLPDSAILDGGVNFYYKWKIPFPKEPLNITDTVINGIKYKRKYMTWQWPGRSDTIRGVGFFQCDKKGSIFSLYNIRDGRCPMSMLIKFSFWNSTKIASKHQIEYLSDKLTPAERKVFSAWKKNAEDSLKAGCTDTLKLKPGN